MTPQLNVGKISHIQIQNNRMRNNGKKIPKCRSEFNKQQQKIETTPNNQEEAENV